MINRLRRFNRSFRPDGIRYVAMMIVGLSVLTGCATWPVPTRSQADRTQPAIAPCVAFFASLDDLAVSENVVDGGYARVKHHPYLRTDRFIASFAGQTDDEHTFGAWIDRMQALDRSARAAEIANLSDTAVASMQPTGSRQSLIERIAECGDRLKAIDSASADRRRQIREHARVPDDYIVARRALGLYPVSRWAVSMGVNRWHRQARRQFSSAPPKGWIATRYVPADTIAPLSAVRIVDQAPHDGLGIPVFTEAQRRALLQAHAPVWEIQYHSDDDRIGWPVHSPNGIPGVDIHRPVTFGLVSFTRFETAVLIQINYVVWFPARPKRHALDIYGGRLDGLTFRVTLDAAGIPILYETVHNCGCYYKAFPTDRLRPRRSIAYAETPLILAAPQPMPNGRRMVVAMDSGSHSVRHLYPYPGSRSTDVPYGLAEYDELKRLPQPSGEPKSLFNRYGIVAGSERLERFILWPMGVYSPGAMRQWGRHAVAFVGRRHFDDPFYLETMFEPAGAFVSPAASKVRPIPGDAQDSATDRHPATSDHATTNRGTH